MEHDLVVFVPGFLGSRLTRDGRDGRDGRDVWDVWGECGTALLGSPPSARALEDMALPPGLGDEPPEHRFPLAADELLMVPDSMPGLLSCMGYADIRAALGNPVDGQYVPFPYDWRLSNRLIAKQLRTRVQRELGRWHEQVDTHYPDRPDDPKVMLVCHSTGGLVGRYYLDCLGGRETARTLVTLGTPHQGMAQAVRLLTGHAVGDDGDLGKDTRALNEVLRDFALNLPSVAQMLPVYDAVRVEGKSRLRTVADRRYPVPGLPTALVADAFSLHRELSEAREAHRTAETGSRPAYQVYCVGSFAHPTVRTVGLSSDGLSFSAQSDAFLGAGDGTVPRESALADPALLDRSVMLWTDHRNADMASARALGEWLTDIRRGLPVSGHLAGDEHITLHAPSEAVAGRPFEVSVLGINIQGRNLRAVMWRVGSPTKYPVEFARNGAGRFRAELVGQPGKWVMEAKVEGPMYADRKVVTVYMA
ncbi:lipase family alpha/beta hydrolase [Streptomyces sp. NPDC057877]|uniref:lipase family alpha/beta hydrolase n=1 Tax=Streptomyces sp. NPDC057877 TaxID=3346269 RepID=UPI0036BA5D2F